MAAQEGTRPLPGCPARLGGGADVSTAAFVLVALDCERGPDGRLTATEVFGYFWQPGEDHEDDMVQTASFIVPAGSRIAQMAHRVTSNGTLARSAGAILRGNVANCPRTGGAECPALNEKSLLLAIEQALGAEPAARSGEPPAPPAAVIAGQIERAYRGYHVWTSDENWWYATKKDSRARGQSPTVHGATPDELTAALSAEETAASRSAAAARPSLGRRR
jgi:hypothetical protein